MAGITFIDTDEAAWRDVSTSIGGGDVVGLLAVKFGMTKEKEYLYAKGDKPRGIQHKNRTPKGEVRLLRSALRTLNAAAIAAGGDDCLDLTVPIVVKIRAKGARTQELYVLVNAEFTEYEHSMSQGDGKGEVTLPIMFTDIKQTI